MSDFVLDRKPGFVNNYECRVHGKWILAGEHAVVRGHQALVFPVASRYLDFSFVPSADHPGIRFIMTGDHGPEMELLVRGTIEKAKEWVGQRDILISGTAQLQSSIPVGAGMGASAALCVAIAKWFSASGYLPAKNVFKMARDLEDIYHGKSSGVDIAVCLANQGIIFSRNSDMSQEPSLVKKNWQPKLFLSHTGERGITKDCVSKVEELIRRRPELGQSLDLKMQRSTELCLSALHSSDSEKGFETLKMAILMAQECFLEWGLVPSSVQDHIRMLYRSGATAVKMTGSGQGGFVLSLWSQAPAHNLAKDGAALIPCF